jgi:hypothetical protein
VPTYHGVKVLILSRYLALTKDSRAHLRVGVRPPGRHGDHLGGNV